MLTQKHKILGLIGRFFFWLLLVSGNAFATKYTQEPKISDEILMGVENFSSFVRIEPGSYKMGSPSREYGRNNDEKAHQVKISKPFWISKFELTNREWNLAFAEEFKKGEPVFFLTDNQIDEISGTIGRNGGHYAIISFGTSGEQEIYFKQAERASNTWKLVKAGKSYTVKNKHLPTIDDLLEMMDKMKCKREGRLKEDNPVTRISYSQAVSFCWELTGRWRKNYNLPFELIVRLPTEAEWEYACRAGNIGFCGLGEGDWLSGENANIDGSNRNYILDERSSKTSFIPLNRGSVSQINEKSPKYSGNAWGLYDMHGNVMEWCYDYYGSYPDHDNSIDPIGPIHGTRRVVRGGSFYRTAQECRSASRAAYEASYRGSEIGMRIVIGFPIR